MGKAQDRADGGRNELVEVGRLTNRVSLKGTAYLTGMVNGRRIAIFELHRPDENGNTHRVLVRRAPRGGQ